MPFRFKFFILTLALIPWTFLFSGMVRAQKVILIDTSSKNSFRGLSAVNDDIVWVSGSGGKVGRSLDGGKHWRWISVPGYEKTDFRDIEAFDADIAVIMGIDSPAIIFKTIDGGNSWRQVFSDASSGMFLDAMDFYDSKNGVVIGDPIGGRFYLALTDDAGDTWRPVPFEDRPLADSGEACFASSGTNIRMTGKQDFYFISGGLSSHLYGIKDKKRLPLIFGKVSTGANSLAIKKRNSLGIVGGDFYLKDDASSNVAFSNDGGTHWLKCEIPPHGYRSCIEYAGGNRWITCGLNGVDYTSNGGRTFDKISELPFHVCRKAKKGTAVFFAGPRGRIGRLSF